MSTASSHKGDGGHDGHSHGAGVTNEKKLTIALVLTGGFLLVEVIGGILTQSLALLSDAAHMLTDVLALVIALIAIKIGRRAADHQRSYGYRRFEILAAAFNAILLFGVAIYIFYEAIQRFLHPPEIQTTGMLVIAAIGLVVNIISMMVLRGGADNSLNMKGAYLEVLSDMVGSVAVIVGAGIIAYTGWRQVDAVLAVLISLWVLPRTWRLLVDSTQVLLEGTPAGVDVAKLRADLSGLPTVLEVHDVHVWSITSGQHSLTAHLDVSAWPTNTILLEAAHEIAMDHGITHATFQVEGGHVGGPLGEHM